ncbi:MAG: CbbQ/NirQ/NorQ/GpvN family protein [Chitinophagales bacterium]
MPYYKIVDKEVDVFDKTYQNKLPLLIKGPTGTGKSRFVEYMAAQHNKEMITVSCHEETSATDLVGRYIIKGAETVWMDGPLTRAVKQGAILYLDEIAEARPDVIVIIHSLTDHRRELYIDKLGITIKAHNDFMLVASYNPGYQRGFKELKPSTRQRFVAITFNYPKQSVEQEIVENETNLASADAKSLVNIANKIRNLTELGLTETVSTRLLVDAAHLIVSGLPKRLSVKTAIIEPLTDEQEVIEALEDLCNLLI